MISIGLLNKFHNRNYNPGAGRFMSEDPIHFWGGDSNLYRYTYNRPLLFIDSFGLSANDVKRMAKLFKKAVKELDNKGLRRKGTGYLNGILNNIGSTLQCGYIGCGAQAEYVADIMVTDALENAFDDNWTFEVVNVTPFHQRLEIKSSNPDDPEIIADPWKNEFDERYKPKTCDPNRKKR
ncbi:RHS repeat-associated core domain protein [Bacteriovorax sp. BAL6_X]|uniref:RHS repeat domain-containing protein n=1 Tax=Bacteriovorax sp. BAL6_X TaxID=1201290 RepID=UPI000385A1EA|nr:RHS repeat-associated core domain-containing protein [Bacteriovorax sp. BAL6_X]EPZ51424.1 RHS repeat-associated core domain protein [Bacteriovorax sp. BAL6_X]